MKKQISELQQKIDSINQDPRKEPSEEARYFVEVVSSKLFELDAPSEVADLLHANVTRLHTDYDADNQLDMEALNNKVYQISELAKIGMASGDDLPSDVGKKILRIMSSKQ